MATNNPPMSVVVEALLFLLRGACETKGASGTCRCEACEFTQKLTGDTSKTEAALLEWAKAVAAFRDGEGGAAAADAADTTLLEYVEANLAPKEKL